MSRFIFNYLESQPQGDILKKWSILQENFPFKGTVDVITSDPSFIVSQGSPVNLCVKRDNGDILVFLDEKWLLEILSVHSMQLWCHMNLEGTCGKIKGQCDTTL